MRSMLSTSMFFAALVLTATPAITAATQPDFSGKWVPIDSARAAQQFEVGLSDVTSSGVTIAMNGNVMTVTRAGLPTRWVGVLNPATSSYVIGTDAEWQGDKLVVMTQGRNAISRAEFSVSQAGILSVQTSSTTTWGVTQRIVQNYRREQ